MSSWERTRRKSINNRELLIAVSRNELEEVDRLTSDDVDINFKDQDGYTALLLAAEYADRNIIRLLLCKGANLDVKNNDCETAVDICVRLNRHDVLQCFEIDKKSTVVLDNFSRDDFVYNQIFRLKVLLIFLYRAIVCKYSFRLVGDDKRIDHLVFSYEVDAKKKYRIIVAKHKVDDDEKITAEDLLSENGAYSLMECFRLYRACKQDLSKDAEIVNFSMCVSVNFNFDSLDKAKMKLTRIEEKDDMVDLKSKTKLPTRYKFTASFTARFIKSVNNREDKATSREFNDFVELLRFVVEQPNEEEIGKIIKKEIGKEFDFVSTKNTYENLLSRIFEWTRGSKDFCNEIEDLFDYLRKNMLVWYNVQDPVKLFTGRREQLQNIHELLKDDGNSIVCISGIAGVGKTEMVKKYIHDYSEFHDNKIVWLNAANYHSLVNSFHKLASEKLGIGIINVDGKEKEMNLLISEVYQNFAKTKSLFVFDDAEAYDSLKDFDSGIDKFLPRLPDNCEKPKIIVTSRKVDWPENVKIQVLEALEENEAVEFICKSLELNASDQAIELAKIVKFVPLAIQLAIACISANSRLQIHDYIDKFAKESQCTSDLYQTTYNLIFEALKQEENLDDCSRILNLVSYFLADNIPVQTLLIFMNDRDKLASAIQVLKKYSLINVYHKVLSIHKSVQESTRGRSNDEKKTLEGILKCIDSAHINSKSVDHLISIWSYCKRHSELVETYHYVFSLIIGELTTCGRIEEAHSMGIEIVELLDALSDKSNVKSGLMSMKSRLGDILLRQGKYEAALREFEELYETEIGLRGSTDSQTLDTKSDIGLALQKLGKTDEALRCYQEILEIKRQTLGEIHSETLSTKSHMATVLMEQEKYDEALPIFESVYKAQKATLGDNHYDTLMTRNSMAALFLFQRKHEEALKIFQGIYNSRDDMLFENHPALLVARQNIATTLQRQKKYDLALEIYEEVYKIQSELLGEDHPEVLAIKGEIALMTQMLGKPEEALSILREVLEKQSQVLGLYHPLVLRTQFFVAHNLEEQCRYSEALVVYQELLKFGITATGVASMQLKLHNSVGSIFMLQGNVDKALKHYSEVLRLSETAYGPNHPQTLIAKSNVGSLYYKKKDYNKALAILSEVHHSEEIIFGKDHETYNSTYHFISKILFEKQLHEAQLRDVSQTPNDDPLIAIENGDVNLLKKLVKRGASINATDASKKTLLHHATRVNRLEIVKFLLKKGADPTSLTDKGKTALHVAVLQNHPDICDELLRNVSCEQSRVLIDAKTTMSGSTALHVAAKNGFYDVTRLLLTRGASYDVKNHDGKQPVELAKNSAILGLLNDVYVLFEQARSGKLECYEKLKDYRLTEYSAVTNARDSHGLNLMLTAVANNQRKIVKAFGELAIINSRASSTLPIFNLNVDEILPLVVCASSRFRDETCTTKTALKHARKLVIAFRAQDKRAFDRNLTMIEDILILLKSRDALADTARIAVDFYLTIMRLSIYSVKLLDAAKRNDLVSVEKSLRELANVNVTDEGGWTALLHASNAGNERMVKLLLDNGACVNSATNTGKNTSLHIAVNKGHLQIAKLLLEKDSTSEFINAKTEAKGSTAVHIAAKIGCLDAIVLLLQNGAVYCLQNKDGQLPVDLTSDQVVRELLELIDELFYDVKNGRAQIVRKLKALERDRLLAVVSTCNEDEFTLANFAVVNEHRELASKIADLYK